MTIHQSKGLEYPIVFVLACAQNLFPLKRTIDFGDIDEERRLFYVACTRAMNELYTCCPRIAQIRGNVQMLEPSQFVKSSPEDAYELLQVKRKFY